MSLLWATAAATGAECLLSTQIYFPFLLAKMFLGFSAENLDKKVRLKTFVYSPGCCAI
jgi:hypothetical protein